MTLHDWCKIKHVEEVWKKTKNSSLIISCDDIKMLNYSSAIIEHFPPSGLMFVQSVPAVVLKLI